MLTAKSVNELKAILKNKWREGIDIGFVPTMGAFHDGHLSLIRRAVKENDYTVVSIFVNPIQFSPGEDLETYPRDLEGDLERSKKEGVDLVFTPSAKEMYEEGHSTYVEVKGLSDKLCGPYRPGHFKGVATIVLKLFNLIKPKRAYFGLKDYQQYQIIRRMVSDLNLDIEIIGCPIVREKDGLAMSSRNLYLSNEERKAATILYETLKYGQKLFDEGERSTKILKSKMEEKIRSEALVRKVDYISIVQKETLEEVDKAYRGAIIATALWIGKARLIDNWEVK